MKKLLLLGAAIMTAMGAMAELPKATPFEGGDDITPKAYKFNDPNAPALNLVQSKSKSGWNLDNYWFAGWLNDNTFGDGGLFVLNGPNVKDDEQMFADVKDAFQVVDFGGTLGKCLVINGKGSTLQDKVNAKGATVELKNFAGGNPGQIPMYIFPDPNVIDNKVKDGHKVFRMRITMNAYYGGTNYGGLAADATTGGNCFGNIYANDDAGNVKGGTVNIANGIKYEEFVYTNAEYYDDPTDDDDPYFDENDNMLWNPNRFMVLEFDATDVGGWDTKDGNFYGFRIKAGVMPGLFNQDAALIIRNIEFFVNDSNEIYGEDDGKANYTDQIKKTYEYYTYGPADQNGVADAVAAPAVEDGRIFNLQGIEVTNTTVPGIYIQNGKKFIVK